MEKPVYKTLVLKYNLHKLSPDATGRVPTLVRVQEELWRWATRWALSNGMEPLPERNPLKYFASNLLYAGKAFDWLKGVKKNGEVKKMQPPLIFNAQLRLGREKDIGNGVLVDLQKREVRIRKWSGQRGNTIALPLTDSAIKWILERVKEGGRLALAAVWVGRSRESNDVKLHVALVFRREVAQMEVKRLLVVDLNALHNGVAWAVVEGERIAAKGVLRPDVFKIQRLQKAAARLDSLCAKEERVCDETVATWSRVWRLLRHWENETTKRLVQLAVQYKAAIVADVPRSSSIRALKEGKYSPQRKIMLNFGRIRRRLQGLAEWYGVPYREERLYSTVCPRCGGRLEVLPDRRVRCACGFEAHRDEVPIFWAAKRFRELIPSFSGSTLYITPS